MASSTSPFTYEAVEVIFGSIYFYFHIQTAPNLQDCPHSDNLTTFPDFTLALFWVLCPGPGLEVAALSTLGDEADCDLGDTADTGGDFGDFGF